MSEPQITGVDLWKSLADELKLPLTQIARLAELAESQDTTENLQSIEIAANSGLKLIDSYLLITSSPQLQLPLTPVSVTAILYDVAQELYDLSKLYDSRLDIKVTGSMPQVMANESGLKAALLALAYTFLTGGLRRPKQSLTLIAKSSEEGIDTGVVSPTANVSAEDLQVARKLFGQARQPASGFTQNSGVGIYIADSLLAGMEAPLRAIKSGRQTGLAATLLPSQQLALL